MAVALDGAAPTTLVSGEAPLDVVVDGTRVYFTGGDDAGLVARVALDGGPFVALVSNQGGPAGLAVDSANVYWTAAFDGTVMVTAK